MSSSKISLEMDWLSTIRVKFFIVNIVELSVSYRVWGLVSDSSINVYNRFIKNLCKTINQPFQSEIFQ